MEQIYRVYIDLETTGLSAWRHGITQIGYIIERASKDNPKGEQLFERSLDLQIFRDQEIQEQALRITGKTVESIAKGLDPTEGLSLFLEDINTYCEGNKVNFIGYNSLSFDEGFLRQFFKRCKGPAYSKVFITPGIDVMPIIAHFLQFVRPDVKEAARKANVKGQFRLATVAAAMGIKATGGLHDALVDIRLTREIYHRCLDESSF